MGDNLSNLIFSRFDYGIKSAYGKQYLTQSLSHYTRSLYLSHLRIWNNFQEDDKKSPHDFESRFQSLLQVKSNQKDQQALIPPILVSQDNYVVNGIHRLAASQLNKYEPNFARCYSQAKYGPSFFSHYINHADGSSFPKNIINEMFRLLLDNVDFNMLLILPRAIKIDGGKMARDLISNSGLQFYHKRYRLTVNVMKLLIAHFYFDQRWIYNDSNQIDWNSVSFKANNIISHASRQYIDCYYVNDEPSSITQLKSKIRNAYGISNESSHSTDNAWQAKIISRFFESQNDLIELCSTPNYMKSKLINEYFVLAAQKEQNNNNQIVTGSALADLYGTRTARDIDFLVKEVQGNDAKKDSSHNKYFYLYPAPINEIAENPKYYFYLFGQKIINKDTFIHFKKRRNEPKDAYDIHAITNIYK